MRQNSIITVIVTALFAGTLSAPAKEPQKIGKGIHAGWYGTAFDTTTVWHPGRICIAWPKMQLTILLPHEEERSGVANLFFRERSTGRVRSLDYLKDNPHYGSSEIYHEDIAHIKYFRYADIFGPGSYDAILLYNSGKYVTCENIVFAEEMRKTVDMTGRPVRKVDEDSREWLGLRKFTDIVGERTLYKDYATSRSHKIIGYLFYSGGRADQFGHIFLNNDAGEQKNAVLTSFDGFFELDVDKESEVYSLDLFMLGPRIAIETKANTWIFAVQGSVSGNENVRRYVD